MKKCLFLITISAMIFGSLIFSASQARADGHALLIGVAEYPGFDRKSWLEGPVYDVSALKKKLSQSFGFASENIIALTDKDATRDNILRNLESLKTVTKPGDFVFLYFSGHGTGSWDKNMKKMGMSPYTGALVPYDFRYESDSDATMKKLIVGNRDIRPVVEELEKNRHVLAIFDACHSGDSVRNLRKRGKPKYLPFAETPDMPESPGQSQEPPYPYRNTLYISAASRLEKALDITTESLRSGAKTIDGKPHGAMTNALLIALEGKADTDHDGKITYNELYQYVRSKVVTEFAHTPQFLFPPENRRIADQSVFSAKNFTVSSANETRDKTLRVKAENIDPDTEKKIAAVSGVKITDKDYDLLITSAKKAEKAIRRNLQIYLASGALLAEVGGSDEAAERIRREVKNREVTDASFSGQNFNVFADIIGSHGVLTEGQSIGFDIRPQADSHILLINMDSKGNINVIYPCSQKELAPVKAGQTLHLPDLGKIAPPNYGTEYIKVIAFRNKPTALEKFLCAEISSSDSKFSELIQMIQHDSKDMAQTTLQVKTCAKSDIVNQD